MFEDVQFHSASLYPGNILHRWQWLRLLTFIVF